MHLQPKVLVRGDSIDESHSFINGQLAKIELEEQIEA